MTYYAASLYWAASYYISEIITVELKIVNSASVLTGYQPHDTFSKYGERKYSHDDRLGNDQ